MKKILIIGGMGPQASILLHQKIINRALEQGATNGSDFPEISNLSIPVPEFIDSGNTRVAALNTIKCSLKIISSKKKFTHCVIACNTAHLLLGEIEQLINGNFVSLINETVKVIEGNSVSKVGLLASPNTIRSGLYAAKLNSSNLVTLDSAEQNITSQIIHGVISGKHDSQRLESQIEILRALGADKVILGCTELSVINSVTNFENIIDPLNIVADKIMAGKV